MKPSIYITYGCHGDERASFEAGESLRFRPRNFKLKKVMVNELACRENVRYIDRDIQEFFSSEKLRQKPTCYEHGVAQKVFERIGRPFMLIDLHTTTSNMDVTVNVSRWTPLLAVLCEKMSHIEGVRILSTPAGGDDRTCLDALPIHGMTIEVGPAKRGEDSPAVAAEIDSVLEIILDFMDDVMDIGLSKVQDGMDGTFECFVERKQVKYPDEDWVISKEFYGFDYQEIPENMILMHNMEDGRTMMGSGITGLCACFIGEEAYRDPKEGNVAFELVERFPAFNPFQRLQ